jgi:hypothetical protein
MATIASLSGCGDAEPQHTAATPMINVTGSKVTRSWSLYSRECSYDDIYACSTAEWHTEAIPDVDAVSPVTADFGDWECHSLGIQHTEDGSESVTLWCTLTDSLQVTAYCSYDDAQESITLIDRANGKYYELTVLCAVEKS